MTKDYPEIEKAFADLTASSSENRHGLIMERVQEHYDESLEYFDKHHIVGTFLHGSQNYGLDTETSDVDTKTIITPTLYHLSVLGKPVSHTHARENNEHIDFKDSRAYTQCFEKQNLNFVEILFTNFRIINEEYAEQWKRLIDAREDIARMNQWAAVHAMMGVGNNKYNMRDRESTPEKTEIVKKYGYNGKEVGNLLRIYDFMEKYINGEEYLACMTPEGDMRKRILDYKKLDVIPFVEAENEALYYFEKLTEMGNNFCMEHPNYAEDKTMRLLKEVNYNIMKIAMSKEVNEPLKNNF